MSYYLFIMLLYPAKTIFVRLLLSTVSQLKAVNKLLPILLTLVIKNAFFRLSFSLLNIIVTILFLRLK